MRLTTPWDKKKQQTHKHWVKKKINIYNKTSNNNKKTNIRTLCLLSIFIISIYLIPSSISKPLPTYFPPPPFLLYLLLLIDDIFWFWYTFMLCFCETRQKLFRLLSSLVFLFGYFVVTLSWVKLIGFFFFWWSRNFGPPAYHSRRSFCCLDKMRNFLSIFLFFSFCPSYLYLKETF